MKNFAIIRLLCVLQAICFAEITVDTSEIFIGMNHVIVELNGPTLVFTEIVELVNNSDKAISSKAENRLKIYLPKGFRNLRFESYFVHESIIADEEGFYDTMAIPPGSHEAVFSYVLDINGETMDITKA